VNDATRALNPRLDLPQFPNPVSALLDQHERGMRTNVSNDGRGFQKEIERTCGAYQARRTAVLRKVDPPTKIVGTGDARRVIFMANPFLDYAGSWTARHGRAIFIECKSTATHRLPFKRSGGLTEDQVSALKSWRHAGAAAGVLWQFSGRVVLFIPEDLLPHEASGAKSLTFESGRPVPRGEGSIIWDFLPVLEAAYWPASK
jgi:penicillin-binding protein-related factor A (putative recombinase)